MTKSNQKKESYVGRRKETIQKTEHTGKSEKRTDQRSTGAVKRVTNFNHNPGKKKADEKDSMVKARDNIHSW